MAKIIEFYIPDGFQKKVKWTPAEQCGEVIEFGPVEKMPDIKKTPEFNLGETAQCLFNA